MTHSSFTVPMVPSYSSEQQQEYIISPQTHDWDNRFAKLSNNGIIAASPTTTTTSLSSPSPPRLLSVVTDTMSLDACLETNNSCIDTSITTAATTTTTTTTTTSRYYFTNTDHEKFYCFIKVLLHLLRKHEQRYSEAACQQELTHFRTQFKLLVRQYVQYHHKLHQVKEDGTCDSCSSYYYYFHRQYSLIHVLEKKLYTLCKEYDLRNTNNNGSNGLLQLWNRAYQYCDSRRHRDHREGNTKIL